jgi:hypothetical protein
MEAMALKMKTKPKLTAVVMNIAQIVSSTTTVQRNGRKEMKMKISKRVKRGLKMQAQIRVQMEPSGPPILPGRGEPGDGGGMVST